MGLHIPGTANVPTNLPLPAAAPSASCQVCGKRVPPGRLRNCSRRCTTRAADRRRHGLPIDDFAMAHAKRKRESNWARRRAVFLAKRARELRAEIVALTAELARVEGQLAEVPS